MNSRNSILAAVKKNQPALESLPDLEQINGIQFPDVTVQFKTILEGIGGRVIDMQGWDHLASFVKSTFSEGDTYVTTLPELTGLTALDNINAHALETVEVAVIRAAFGVAENGAVWATEEAMQVRVLPFICQHLVVVLDKKDIVHNMHQAYDRIGNAAYGFGAFIAGPSKTADIEQSLVLGAHGPRSMTAFLH